MRLARAFAALGYHLVLTLDQRGAAAMPPDEGGRPIYGIIDEPDPLDEETDRQKAVALPLRPALRPGMP